MDPRSEPSCRFTDYNIRFFGKSYDRKNDPCGYQSTPPDPPHLLIPHHPLFSLVKSAGFYQGFRGLEGGRAVYFGVWRTPASLYRYAGRRSPGTMYRHKKNLRAGNYERSGEPYDYQSTPSDPLRLPEPACRKPPLRYPPCPKPRPLPRSAAVTLLHMTSSVPAGDRPFIPAWFRLFPNYDL
jgi:hypothetical protein